jgi:Flp pilus assembly protein TadG
MVEFTIVLLPLLLLLFGIIELGVVMYDKVTVVQDAREAVRLASVNDPAGLTILGDAPAGSTLRIDCAPGVGTGDGQGTYNVGDKITAHVTYVHTFVTPLIGDLFGGSITLGSDATMTLEGPPTNYPGCN